MFQTTTILQSVGRRAWITEIPGSPSLQSGCNACVYLHSSLTIREAINIVGSGISGLYSREAFRIGILGSDDAWCLFPLSVIGFGSLNSPVYVGNRDDKANVDVC